jgi:hypothetical protein
MNQEIKYSGFSVAPSDYECADGALAASINLIPEEGALKPILSPSTKFTLDKGRKVVYIHKGNGYINYITTHEANGYTIFSYHKSRDAFLSLLQDETMVDINAIGNMLIVSTNKHLHYCYFKNNRYINLGTELPKVDIKFALSAKPVSYNHVTNVSYSDYSSAEASWTDYTNKSFTYSNEKDLKIFDISFSQDLKSGHEYKIKVGGSGFNTLTLFAQNNTTNEYEAICVVRRNRETIIKFPDTHKSSFRIRLYDSNLETPTKASGTIEILEGFEKKFTGKVIAYNDSNYTAIAAVINKFVAEQATNKDKFIYPFFIRYALRLSDGSHARISEPILMIPNSGYAPFISFIEGDKKLYLYAFIADLQCLFLNSIEEKWKDFISGVDVFVSEQVYPYNQGANFDASKNLFSYALIRKENNINQVKGTNYGYVDLPDEYYNNYYGRAKLDLYEVAKDVFNFSDFNVRENWQIIKIAPVENTREKLENVSQFYLAHSFDFDEIKKGVDDTGTENYTTIKLKEGTLSSLVVRQPLSDDQLSNCTFLNAHLTTYNQRLHLFDYNLQHAKPTVPSRQNGQIYRYDSYGELYKLQVFIRTAQGERIVECNADEGDYNYSTDTTWFFYPHNGAYRAVLYFKGTDNKTNIAGLNLKQHPILNGAYWMADTIDGSMVITSVVDSDNAACAQVDDISHYPNAVLQSNVATPFLFPSSLMTSLGVQKIKALSSAAKALSQGQFGQFPLYAFTSEGVWALEVSTTGTYTARQPITRDVCINNNAVTQLDSAVIFPTDRGIMLLSGSQAQCISEAINSEYPFDVRKLPAFEKLHNMLNHKPSTDKCLPTLPFSEFLKQCQMLYDYVHQRIIVYAPNITYAYVLSLKTKQWGMIFSNITSHLNAYPEALAIDANNNVLNFSVQNAEAVKCLYVTRPLKLEAANVLKTIDTLIQRGMFSKGNVSTVLYGSRDLQNWYLVWSSKDHYLKGFRGSPYKFFRIAGVATLSPDENIIGASVSFAPRQTNKMR